MTILYFAYGSNMLTARLQARCKSARPLGRGRAEGYVISFYKTGKDESGKATVATSKHRDACVHGVVFEIAKEELANLDRIEGNGRGYNRNDTFMIIGPRTNEIQPVVTYEADPNSVCPSLIPFDWYLNLVLRGAEEHKLPQSYIEKLAAHSSIADPCRFRRTQLEALALLNAEQTKPNDQKKPIVRLQGFESAG